MKDTVKTTVTVNPHCSDTEQVKIVITDSDNSTKEYLMNDGEYRGFDVFAGNTITVEEVEK